MVESGSSENHCELRPLIFNSPAMPMLARMMIVGKSVFRKLYFVQGEDEIKKKDLLDLVVQEKLYEFSDVIMLASIQMFVTDVKNVFVRNKWEINKINHCFMAIKRKKIVFQYLLIFCRFE